MTPPDPQPDRHLAVLRTPHLNALLDGRKRVESRLSRNRIAPFQRVAVGDVLFLKEVGGRVRAASRVERVRFYEIDGPQGVQELRDRYNHLIQGPPEYWASKRHARYATLLWLTRPQYIRIASDAPRVPPLFGRAWLALESIHFEPMKRHGSYTPADAKKRRTTQRARSRA
jgi:hypothetical protein